MGMSNGAAALAWLTLGLVLTSSNRVLAEDRPQAPAIELDTRLREIFTISDCTYISGLTCKVHYNGKAPLPTEVFFVELDAKDKPIGKRVRLIYPHLKKGESGLATFRIQAAAPAQIRLEASGNGPWKDPY